MITHKMLQTPSPAGRPGRHRLLPIAGGGVAVAALAHLGGGALAMHVGIPAALAYFGLETALPNLGGGALTIGIVAVVAIKLLVVFGVFGGAFGARRWLQRR